ncbi:unnamed protein product [Tilletia controversa]|nr:unnamed protein product [Tilletia controversa]
MASVLKPKFEYDEDVNIKEYVPVMTRSSHSNGDVPLSEHEWNISRRTRDGHRGTQSEKEGQNQNRN